MPTLQPGESDADFLARVEAEEAAAFAAAVSEWRAERAAGRGEAKVVEVGGSFAGAGAADELKGVEEDWLAGGDGESEDGVDLKDLSEQFRAAEEAVGTRLGGVLPESAQRRLYALHMVARHGTAPEVHDPAELQVEQWEAWRDAGELTAEAAMVEYVRIATAAEEGGAAAAAGAVGGGEQELPPDLLAALEASGFKRAEDGGGAGGGTGGGAPDVWAAAQAGGAAALAPFLPAQRDALDEDGLSPLHHAVDREQLAAVRALVEHAGRPV